MSALVRYEVPPDARLVIRSKAGQMLAKATTIPDAKKAISAAAALKVWVREEKLGNEAQKEAAAFAVRAQARAGELLAAMEKDKGGRPKTGAGRAPVSGYGAALKETGIGKEQAARYQQMASVPEPLREKLIETAMSDESAEVSAAAILGAAKVVKELKKSGEQSERALERAALEHAEAERAAKKAKAEGKTRSWPTKPTPEQREQAELFKGVWELEQALATLAGGAWTAAEMVEKVRGCDYSAPIRKHLKKAAHWLSAFAAAWEA